MALSNKRFATAEARKIARKRALRKRTLVYRVLVRTLSRCMQVWALNAAFKRPY